MQHVVVIGSDKMEPVHILAADPAVQITALVKPKYADLYKGLAVVCPVDDVADVMQAADRVLRMTRSQPVDAVVCPIERSLLTGGYVRSCLGLPGMTYDQTLGFANKLVMKRRLRAAGLPVTDFERLDRLADVPGLGERLGWPLILKPAVGSGTMNTLRVDSAEHFARLQAAGELLCLEQLSVPLLAERFVAMAAEYHCDGVVQNGEVLFAAVSCYNTPPLSGMGGILGSYVLPEGAAQLAPISELHRRVVASLGMASGVTHLEVFETGGGFLIGEITCRPGGGGIVRNIERHSGVCMWNAFVQTALGRPVALVPRTRPGISGWCGLPGRNGRIVAISPASELAAIPGVEEVHFKQAVGDIVAEKLTSVFNAGMLFFHLQREADVAPFLDEVRRRYYLEVANVDG